MIHKRKHIKYLIFFLVLSTLFYSCNPARKLAEGEYLLTKNKISNDAPTITHNDLENYLKQKPNRKIFGVFAFRLWLHNFVNEEKVNHKRILHDIKNEEKNNKRIAKGKQPKKYTRKLFGEWLIDISEPPVIYDSLLTYKTSTLLKSFLNNKGYFNSLVTDTVKFKRRKKATVYYKIKANKAFTINKLVYDIPDDLVKYYVMADTSNSLIVKGKNYDVDVFEQERERITKELNNNGYFLFTKDYIHYEWDSTTNKKVDILLRIKNYETKLNKYSDSIVELPHPRFYIGNVYIQTDFVSKKTSPIPNDTLKIDDYTIFYKKKLRYKTKLLLSSIFIHKGELYQIKNAEDSYKRLAEIKAFKTINIYFTIGKDNYLDCHVQLSPILKQFYTIEALGKNTSGALGVEASFVYQNRNLFKGAEVFEFRLKGGIEAQRTFNSNKNTTGNVSQEFNTIEFGPEVNIYVPRFVSPFNIHISKRGNPRTVFTSAFNYQRRPDYTRWITNISFGYTWKETVTKTHSISPLVVNFVKVELQPEFYDYLKEKIKDLYILNSYTDHLSTSTRYSFVYNQQDLRKFKNFSFFKLNLESSGNILRGIYDLVNSYQPNTFAKDANGSYKLMGIVYSQYVRADADYRFYYNPNITNKIVFRIAAGIGIPFKNFPSLPFERSFYSGGANGIRAWQARTLGPGSYSNKEFSFDQFGDGQLEGNVEYRFNLFKMLNGAVFVDAGNTWLQKPDANRVGGDFDINRFYKEIAIGSGFGLRADLSFFVLRLDLGIKIKDPQFAENNRWVIEHLFDPAWKENYFNKHNASNYNFFALNIGIGYPF